MEATAPVFSKIIVVTMSDFEDIPAIGDAVVDEEREDTPSEDEVVKGKEPGK